MAYTTVAQVCAFYPTFTRNGNEGPSDDDIQGWIDDISDEIDSILMRRFQQRIATYAGGSFATQYAAFLAALPAQAYVAGSAETPPSGLLEHINHEGAAAELGRALGTSGIATAKDSAERFDAKFKESLRKLNARDEQGKPQTQGGDYDFLFDPLAKVETPRPQMGGIAGGDQLPGQSRSEGNSNVFKKYDRREF